MPTFTTPTTVEYSSDHFWGRFGITVGVSVVKVNGHFQEMAYPWMGNLLGQDGVDYFLGGRTYTITNAVAVALEADGFTIGDPPPPPPPPGGGHPYGFGPFGSGPFGGSV